MNKVTIGVRILLGLVFAASGISYFFVTPPPLEGDLATFMNGLLASKYFLYLLKGTEFVGGLMLLSGYFVPLALVVLAPVMLNIFLVNAFLAPEGIAIPIVMGALMIYLSFFSKEYSPRIKSLFQAK